MHREKAMKIMASSPAARRGMPEQKTGAKIAVGEIAIFIDDLKRICHPEIISYSVEGNGYITIAYKNSLPEEKVKEIRQLILERWPQASVGFLEEKAYQQRMRKMRGPLKTAIVRVQT